MAFLSRRHIRSDLFSSFDASSLSFSDVEPGDGQRWTTWPSTIPTQRGPKPWPSWLVQDARALAKKTAHGREVGASAWSLAEFEALCRMHELGAPVPYPVQVNGTEVLMEFLGDESGTAAPRVAQMRGDREELGGYYAQIVEIMRIFAAAGFAHGDLSAYNLLVHEGRVRVIDLPQIVDIIANPQGMDLLHRDCVNICDWFARRRVECDAEELFAELLAASYA